MSVKEAIRKRYSCRAYETRPVEQEKLDVIFEAARLAPSARNTQDWRFVVVTQAATRQALAAAANNQKSLEQAAVVIAACSISDRVMTCGQPIAAIDVSIALEHIALQATELGLATCWIGSFYPEKVRAVLGIPDDVAVVELMTLGYPADKCSEAKRLGLEEIVSCEKWGF